MLTEEFNKMAEGVLPERNDFEQETPNEESLESNQDIPKGSEIDQLKAEISEQKDKFLRLFAEFDNYKKRTVRERMDLIRNAR